MTDFNFLYGVDDVIALFPGLNEVNDVNALMKYYTLIFGWLVHYSSEALYTQSVLCTLDTAEWSKQIECTLIQHIPE